MGVAGAVSGMLAFKLPGGTARERVCQVSHRLVAYMLRNVDVMVPEWGCEIVMQRGENGNQCLACFGAWLFGISVGYR